MIFRQMFDPVSSTYTYLIASRQGGEALLIDPVLERCERYLQLLDELDLQLVKAVDTHCHADHITGLGSLRDATRCVTVMGKASQVDCVSMRVDEGDTIDIETVSMDVLYTPGHTDDSYSFLWGGQVFTGDTLLIRGTGRTDFQNGDPRDSYNSIFNKLLKLPDETLVYPAHDYKGDTVSTIGKERAHNPRLQVSSVDEYVEIMENLDLPNPKMMDQAVPANLQIGFKPDDPGIQAATLGVDDARKHLVGNPNMLFVDLREDAERRRDGVIPGSVHVPYVHLHDQIVPGGLLHRMARDSGKSLLFYCAYGERSALALRDAFEAGLKTARHLGGGLDAWSRAGVPTETPSDAA